MIIGIDASRAFQKNRTGVEEYSYQVIKNLVNYLKNDQVVLYVKKNQKSKIKNQNDNAKFKNDVLLEIPNSWEIKEINLPYLWTQIGLSVEMFFHPVDVLFIPAHTVPFIHPRNTIVTIHGLEYEFCPEAYSSWEKFYMRLVIKNSCRWAQKIIAVSQNTKKDLMNLYNVPENKISVIYEGCNNELGIMNHELRKFDKYKPYLAFIGRLEERKNIIGIIKAFEILKEHYKIPHKLILAGKFGYGKEKIQEELKNTNCGQDIILPGFVNEEEKWELLKGADVFLFPTFYEGFGIPILEAQSVGCPVVAGNNSSIPEVTECHPESCPELNSGSPNSGSNKFKLDSGSEAGMTNISVLLVDPNNAEQIADATYKLISDKNLRDDIVKKGSENVQRFSWEKCAELIAQTLTETDKDMKFNK